MKITQKQSKKTTSARSKASKPVSVRAHVKHHTKKILVPHKVNSYFPHLIRWPGLAAVLLIALLAQGTYSFVTTGKINVLGRISDITTIELVDDTNKEREVAGLTPLVINDQLSKAAFLRAQDMFEKNYWSHISPTGVQPWKWFGDVGYNYSYAGENLAKNYPTAQATVDAWMKSETHRQNVMNVNYTEVGFAVVDGELNGQNTTLIVALYGAPVTAEALGLQTANQGISFSASSVASKGTNPLEYFGSALSVLSPVTVAILGLFGLVAIVGVATHHYRNKLPKAWRQSWRSHHGFYTFIGMMMLGVLIIIATGGGQI